MSPALLSLPWLVPIGGFLWSRRHLPGRRWLVTGVLFGLVAESPSFGLYLLGMLSPFTFPLVIAAFPLALLHTAPGYELAVATGLVASGEPVEPPSVVTLLNALFWCASYAALGAWLDRRRPGGGAVGDAASA